MSRSDSTRPANCRPSSAPSQRAQPRGGHGHDAGVDLRDRALLARSRPCCSTMRSTRAGRIAHDAPVAGGSGSRAVRSASCVRPGARHEARERRGADQRHVAVEHQHDVLVRHARHRLQRPRGRCLSAPPAAPTRRRRPANAARTASAPWPWTTWIAAGSKRARRLEHVREQRPASQRLQHLRQLATSCACPGPRPGSRRKGASAGLYRSPVPEPGDSPRLRQRRDLPLRAQG